MRLFGKRCYLRVAFSEFCILLVSKRRFGVWVFGFRMWSPGTKGKTATRLEQKKQTNRPDKPENSIWLSPGGVPIRDPAPGTKN